MKSEELELSLRTEFESYLKGIFAGMQQDVADFQTNFEAEFAKHKAQTDEAFRSLSARFESDLTFDKAFTESVVEHLRLARDDGAQLTANAFGEAEKLEKSTPAANYDLLRDAIDDICSQSTQASILRSLVDQVSHFTPRGAFFIVKNDSFVCWRKFDRSGHSDDDSVRSLHFPLTADTLLAGAVSTLRTDDGSSDSHTEDSLYLDALNFDRPERMFAVPLIARGRGVAVLFAAQDNDGDTVSLEAIESLVRVAGLTVELRAAAQPVAQEAPAYVPMPAEAEVADARLEDVASEHDAPVEDAEFEEYTGEVALEETEAEVQEESFVEAEAEVPNFGEVTPFEPAAEEAETEQPHYQEVDVREAAIVEEAAPAEDIYAETVNDFAFASGDSYDASAPVETAPDAEPVEEYAYAAETKNGTNGSSYDITTEAVVEVAAAQPAKSGFRDRNVDLPIEVADDERRFHNDARRFARLLVSEIKLYNEEKVNDGRDGGDLYDRLREAIDRSREMYEKRVKPQVAAKFDYFHYELVSNLAQGNDAKLGSSYPGANV